MGNLIVENQVHYEFFATADGSPSIRLSSDKYRPEAMHHCDGALSESLFIYHAVLQQSQERGAAPRVLSVGLGCGYNEMITVAHFMRANARPALRAADGNSADVVTSDSPTHEILPRDFYLESFEGDGRLRETFLQWLLKPYDTKESVSHSGLNNESTTELGTAITNTFTEVLRLVSLHFEVAPEKLKSTLQSLRESGQFVQRDWLTAETAFTKNFGTVFFDAFSNQSTPEIWTDDFLVKFLDKATANPCGFATYAATGALNRALKQNGFIRENQKGFSGKRESTRAFKSL